MTGNRLNEVLRDWGAALDRLEEVLAEGADHGDAVIRDALILRFTLVAQDVRPFAPMLREAWREVCAGAESRPA